MNEFGCNKTGRRRSRGLRFQVSPSSQLASQFPPPRSSSQSTCSPPSPLSSSSPPALSLRRLTPQFRPRESFFRARRDDQCLLNSLASLSQYVGHRMRDHVALVLWNPPSLRHLNKYPFPVILRDLRSCSFSILAYFSRLYAIPGGQVGGTPLENIVTTSTSPYPWLVNLGEGMSQLIGTRLYVYILTDCRSQQ